APGFGDPPSAQGRAEQGSYPAIGGALARGGEQPPYGVLSNCSRRSSMSSLEMPINTSSTPSAKDATSAAGWPLTTESSNELPSASSNEPLLHDPKASMAMLGSGGASLKLTTSSASARGTSMGRTPVTFRVENVKLFPYCDAIDTNP